MSSPVGRFVGDIEIGRWVTPGLPGLPAASAPPPPSLSAIADRALTFLLRAPLPHSGFVCRHAWLLSSCPPGRQVPAGGAPGEAEFRIHAALAEARGITGRTDGEETDRRLWQALLEAPTAGAAPAALGMLLQGLAERHAAAGEAGDAERARGIFLSLKALVREKWDLPYFPGPAGGAPAGGSPAAGFLTPLSSASTAMSILAYGKLCQDEEALELSRRLARGIVAGVGDSGIADDGSFTGLSAPRVQDARAVAEVASTFADRDMLLWAQRVLDFIRRVGGDTGFVPRIIPGEKEGSGREAGPAREAGECAAPAGDTCAAAGAACLAAALARAGFTSSFDSLEQSLRNHIPFLPFTPSPAFTAWYTRRHAGRPREEVQAGLAAAADCAGAFISNPAPGGLAAEAAGIPPLLAAACCTAEAVRALAAAYRVGVTEAGGAVDVNLALERETPFVRVASPGAGEGRLAVAVKKACALRVRVPSWTDRSGMTVQRGGSPAMVSYDEDYVCLEGLRAGETVVVRWPLPLFTQSVTLPAPGGGAPFRWSWAGGTVTGIQPAAAELPF
jgi:hypothetical protein